MVRVLCALAVLAFSCEAVPAQISILGTTSMGLPTIPGAVVLSPLSGPSPFSAATLPGAPDTSLAPVPLGSDPTTPGTVVNCAPPSAIAVATLPGSISASPLGSTTGTAVTSAPIGSALNASGDCSLNGNTGPGNPAALPLMTPTISGALPGTLQPPTPNLGEASISPPAMTPTPNATACNESLSMNLATPGLIASPETASAALRPPGC
jgi:hypothetical protein